MLKTSQFLKLNIGSFQSTPFSWRTSWSCSMWSSRARWWWNVSWIPLYAIGRDLPLCFFQPWLIDQILCWGAPTVEGGLVVLVQDDLGERVHVGVVWRMDSNVCYRWRVATLKHWPNPLLRGTHSRGGTSCTGSRRSRRTCSCWGCVAHGFQCML